jgi:hypothetical protein
MKPDESFKFDPAQFVASFAEAVKSEGLDSTRLTVPTIATKTVEPPTEIPRELVIVGDGSKHAQWDAPPLRDLFRGSQKPPGDMAHYPPEYVPLFAFIERHAVNICDAHGDKTDGEFEEWYSNLRRRPDGRSLGVCHDQLWRVLAVLLAMRPTSQAEYEAVVGQLAISARRFRMGGHASRNYVDYLRQMF